MGRDAQRREFSHTAKHWSLSVQIEYHKSKKRREERSGATFFSFKNALCWSYKYFSLSHNERPVVMSQKCECGIKQGQSREEIVDIQLHFFIVHFSLNGRLSFRVEFIEENASCHVQCWALIIEIFSLLLNKSLTHTCSLFWINIKAVPFFIKEIYL